MMLGVASEELGGKMAAVLHRLGTKHSLVVHGLDGLDEISISGSTRVWEVSARGVSSPYEVSPRSLGFETASLTEIKGGTPEENAGALRRILDGEKGARRNVVVMNAAAALAAAGRAPDLKGGVRLSEEAIDSGRAGEKLDKLVELSQSLGR
jgi:anthranilate phosphoribosyltransferase